MFQGLDEQNDIIFPPGFLKILQHTALDLKAVGLPGEGCRFLAGFKAKSLKALILESSQEEAGVTADLQNLEVFGRGSWGLIQLKTL